MLRRRAIEAMKNGVTQRTPDATVTAPQPGAKGEAHSIGKERKTAQGTEEAVPAPGCHSTQALPGVHGGPKPLTFVLTQQQGGCQPSIHNGLLVQDGGGRGRELGVAYGGEEGGEQATQSLLSPLPTHHPPSHMTVVLSVPQAVP